VLGGGGIDLHAADRILYKLSCRGRWRSAVAVTAFLVFGGHPGLFLKEAIGRITNGWRDEGRARTVGSGGRIGSDRCEGRRRCVPNKCACQRVDALVDCTSPPNSDDVAGRSKIERIGHLAARLGMYGQERLPPVDLVAEPNGHSNAGGLDVGRSGLARLQTRSTALSATLVKSRT